MTGQEHGSRDTRRAFCDHEVLAVHLGTGMRISWPSIRGLRPSGEEAIAFSTAGSVCASAQQSVQKQMCVQYEPQHTALMNFLQLC